MPASAPHADIRSHRRDLHGVDRAAAAGKLLSEGGGLSEACEGVPQVAVSEVSEACEASCRLRPVAAFHHCRHSNLPGGPLQVVVFPFADVQRQLIASFDSLGFVNAVAGCTSDLAITQYSTGNLYSLGNPTFTAEGAKVRISHPHSPPPATYPQRALPYR